MREKVSACIVTKNEESKIRRCIESITWCDGIVIVDSFSDDRTLEICREYTSHVHQRKWHGYIRQRNLTLELVSHPWIFFVDADEMVSPQLRDEIIEEFEKGTGEIAGYQFPRKVYYLDRWIRHGEWYPDTKLRLFKKALGYSAGQEPHDHVEVEGPVKTLKGPLWHYTYDDILDHIETMNRFSGITAMAKYNAGTRFVWGDFLFRPIWRFLKGFVFKLGLLDGRRGFLIAVISSFGVAMKYAKLWEIELEKSKKETPPPSIGN